MRFIVFLMLGALFISTEACKKGPNDPEFSIHSRAARLSGDWDVVSGMWQEPGTETVYDGEYFIITTNDSLVDSLAVNLDYSFDRNGNYTRTIITDYPTDWFGDNRPAFTEDVTVKGFWNFVGGNDGIKEKSQLLLRETEVNTAVSNASSAVEIMTYEGQTEGFIYDIDRLAKSEIVLTYNLLITDKTGTIVKSGELKLDRK